MQILWWTLSILLIVTGLICTVVPLLPGTFLIFLGALFHKLMLGPEHSVSWVTIAGIGVLMVIGQALDFLSGSLGAKYFGATRWGAIGGIIGGVVGIFFGILGLLVGPLVGVLIGELLGGRGLVPSARSTWGTLLGTGAGLVIKAVLAVAMVAWFTIALLV